MENACKKATHKELCEQALKEYEEMAKECSIWNSLIPKAIKFYQKRITPKPRGN